MSAIVNMLTVVAASVASSVIVSEYQNARFRDREIMAALATKEGAMKNGTLMKVAGTRDDLIGGVVTDVWNVATNISGAIPRSNERPNVKFVLDQCYWPVSISLDTTFEATWGIQNNGSAGEIFLGVEYGGEYPTMFWHEVVEAGYAAVVGVTITMREFYEAIGASVPSPGYHNLTFQAGYVGEPPNGDNGDIPGEGWWDKNKKWVLYGGLGVGALILTTNFILPAMKKD